LEWPEKEAFPAEGHQLAPPKSIECGLCGRSLEPEVRECPVCATPAAVQPSVQPLAGVDEALPLRSWGSPADVRKPSNSRLTWPAKEDGYEEKSQRRLLRRPIRVALGLGFSVAVLVGALIYAI
jgi:hypothetical protein